MTPRHFVARRILTRSYTAGFLAALLLPKSASGQSAVEVLQDFDMEQVRVTDAYYQNAATKEMEYLLRLSPDRLLAGFKAVSEGKDPATGVTLYGGWEGGWSLLRGHTMGHYLTALAQGYKQTKGVDATLNTKIKTNLDYTIAQLKAFQDKSSKGYLFASLETHFDVVEGKITGDQWVPWYTMHKLIAGLVDVYKLTGNATALQIASKLGDWTHSRVSLWSASVQSRVLGVEYGGMNDCLYELYKLTKKETHLAAAHKFDEDSLFTPISKGTNTLSGKHANTQIPKFIGALNRYRTLGTGEKFYYTAAEQFFALVLRDHTYVTGGNSEGEHFRAPGVLDGTRDGVNNESCNSYNMLKLSRDLFKVTGDVKYAQYYERTHLNEVMSSINPTNGMTTYFKPMGTGYFKVFGTETDTFWCCNGTGMENYTKLNDSIYFHDSSDVYVNLYLSSTLDWAAKWFGLTQSASVPLSNKVSFTIDAAPSTAVGIKFRLPYWIAAGESVAVTLNGQCLPTTTSNGYAAVSRVWTKGDKIELTFPAEVQVSRLQDNKNAVAFTYGPVVLSAGLGTQSMVSTGYLASKQATLPSGVTLRDSIKIDSSTTIEDWLKNIKTNLVQTEGKLEFKLKNTDANNALTFTPQYQRYADRYGIYFKLTGTQGTASPTASTTGGATSVSVAPCSASGGASSTGGTSSVGGASGTGTSGGSNSGGAANTNGGTSTGNTVGSGGRDNAVAGSAATASGGNGALGGGGLGNGTSSSTAGATATTDDERDSGGCSCTLAQSSRSTSALGLLLSLGLVFSRRGRRRNPS
ncbi:MAG: glycoside hydrolase family 127 protein [Polyangiaceae bacterium]